MPEEHDVELFLPGEGGESLTTGDLAVLARILDEELRTTGEARLRWYRNNRHRYAAYVAAVRRIVDRSGPGVAPLHAAFEMRHPPRGIEPCAIDNAAAVFLARVAARIEPDLRRAFDFRDAPAADAIFAAGWLPDMI